MSGKRMAKGKERVERNVKTVRGASHCGALNESDRSTKNYSFLVPLHAFLVFEWIRP